MPTRRPTQPHQHTGTTQLTRPKRLRCHGVIAALGRLDVAGLRERIGAFPNEQSHGAHTVVSGWN